MPGLLVDELVEVGLVTEAQARAVREEDGPVSTSQVMARLVELGLDERALAGFFVSQGFGPMLQSAELARADLDLAHRVRPADAHRLCAVPLRPSGVGAIVAMADPTDDEAVAELSAMLGGRILPTVAKLSDLRDYLDRVYPREVSSSAPDSDPGTQARLPSGVMPLVQEKPDAGDDTEFDRTAALPDFASNASPAWDRAWSRSSTERDVSLTPKSSRAPSQMPLPSLAAPPSAPAEAVTESELDAHLAALGRAQSRDDAVERACEACAATSRGAAFLALRKGVFRGWAGAGDEVTTAAIRSLWVPASNPSTLNEVLHSGKPFRGAYGQTAADHLFRAAFGARGHEVVIVPVLVGTRMVGVLCANDPRGETDGIERLAAALGAAFERLIVAHKVRS
jgi:hypothetical protein